MAETGLGEVLAYLRKTCAIKAARKLNDAELMRRFVVEREEAAFSALVRRHGPMVLSVCRRVLSDGHSAEDAFQATFLVLVRRIASLSRNKPLAGWLYGVAQRIALRARTQNAGRRDRERQAADMPRTEPLDDVTWQELRTVLDEEIARLPEKYRTPIVLCYFEGKTHDQAAHELGYPKRSLTSRLAKARDLLRTQLSRRGITLSSAVLAAALAEKTAGAAVGAMLTINTVKAAMIVVAGKAIAGSVLSAKAIALAEEGMKATIGISGKVVVLLLTLGLAAGGAGLASYGGWRERARDVPAAQEASKEPRMTATAMTQQGTAKEAEKLFLAMEKKIREAKTLKIAFQFNADDGKNLTGKGSYVLAEDNRARIEIAGKDDGGKLWQKEIVSDGKQVFIRNTGVADVPPVSTPSHFNVSATGVLMRLGAFFTAVWFEPRNVSDAIDINAEMRVRDFKLGDKEQIGNQESQIIECVMTIDRFAGGKARTKFWIDPKSSMPLKRNVVLTLDGQKDAAFSEVYSEFAINPPLDSKLFSLPADMPVATPKVEKLFAIKGKTSGKETKGSAVLLDLYGDPLPPDALARLGTTRFRHGLALVAVACSPDGKLFATADFSGNEQSSICIWESDTGKALQREINVARTSMLAFSADSKSLITENSVIEVATGKELRRLAGRSPGLTSAACSPDRKILAKAEHFGSKTRVLLIDVETGKEIRRFDWNSGHDFKSPGQSAPTPPAFSPDGKFLATGNEDKSINLWDVATAKEIRRLEGHDNAVSYLTFAPNGKTLASNGYSEGAVLVWDVETGKLSNRIKVEAKSPVGIFSPDGSLLIFNWDLGNAGLYDPVTGKELRSWKMKTWGACFAFTPDGKTLLSSSFLEAGTIIRRDLSTGKEIVPPGTHIGPIDKLQFTPDGKTLFSGGADRKVRDWDLATGKARDREFGEPLGPNDPTLLGGIRSLSPTGKVIALNMSDSFSNVKEAKKGAIVYLYDAETGKELRTIPQGSPSDSATFSSDGKLMATANQDGLRLWDLESGKVLHQMPMEQVKARSSLAFSPDSKVLALNDGANIRLYDVATLKELRSWTSSGSGLGFSPDGKSLASMGRGSIVIWTAENGKKLQQLQLGEKYTTGLAFSPSGRCLASWENGEVIHFWDLLSGEKTYEIHTGQGSVSSAAFSPDGRTLATGGADSTILLWDLTGHAGEDQSKATPMSAEALDRSWVDLGSNAVKADVAIWALFQGAKESVTFLKERLKPIAAANAQQVAKLIADLGSEQFAARQKASAALEKLGERAEAQMRKALAEKTNLELRQRLVQVLDILDRSPEITRWLRAIEVLEHIATADARRLLDSLATQSPNPRVAEAATSALARLAKRT